MESGKFDLENVPEVNSTTNGSVATYKSLSEDDVNHQELQQSKVEDDKDLAMGQKVDEAEVDDGVKEKMLNEESPKKKSNKNATEVIFMSENGDTKIDIDCVKPALCGMGKEELMKYANDPFWVRLRWILFVGFWILWFAMLGGAIAIIIMAPKCVSPQPKTWWEESPILQIESAEIAGKDLKSVESLLDSLKSQHIKVISLASILKGDPGHIEDFKSVRSQIGDVEFVEQIIAAAKARDQKILLEFDPNHSSLNHPWFSRSVNGEDPYADYYVWANGKMSPEGNRQPPNNWLSVNGGSAWTFNTQRGQFYLHQFNQTQPDFNFHNPLVVEEFSDILSFWLNRGVSGFRLGSTQYLTEDPARQNEQSSATPADPAEYQYLMHVHTKDREDNAKILTQWREIVTNITKNNGLFALKDDIASDTLAVYNENKRLIDLPQSSQFLATANAGITARALQNGISNWISGVNVTWPSWDVNGGARPLRKRMPADIADSVILMTLLLPGTPIFKLNDTLSSARKEFAILSAKRSEDTFLYGDFNSYIINGTVFAYTRVKNGSPTYLVAYQSSEESGIIDVSTLPFMPPEVNVVTHSPNYLPQNGTVAIQATLSTKAIEMPAKSTLVVSFAPAS
ncbi:hypothetical protein PV326_003990 [Microctonus aethiopoides]|nr:hypothetical protein PV326_003990 [Microctonus aethiopoides]